MPSFNFTNTVRSLRLPVCDLMGFHFQDSILLCTILLSYDFSELRTDYAPRSLNPNMSALTRHPKIYKKAEASHSGLLRAQEVHLSNDMHDQKPGSASLGVIKGSAAAITVAAAPKRMKCSYS
jgi:hypothetical protein